MQVGVLGPLLVQVAGRDVTPRGQRLRDVFAVLLQRRGRPVRAELLLDLVWAESAAALQVSAVHTTVARLRKQLGAGVITSLDTGYLIDSSIGTDEDSFTDLVGRGRRRLDRDGPVAASADYRAALACWRGDVAFQNVRADLVETDRARLAELRATAIEELAGLLLDHPEAGEPTEAHALAIGLIAQQPLREKPYQLAMVAAVRSHHQADAVAGYQALRDRLRTELGIEPSQASADLYATILRQDLAPPAGSTVTRPPPHPSGVPAAVSPLIGRDAEMTQLHDVVATGQRLVTVIGPGGVGKSRLMIEFGARSRTKVVHYTELSGMTLVGPGELAEAIALSLGFPLIRPDPVDSLVAALGHGGSLLLIDEAEWAIEAVTSVARTILERCHGVQIVITSRIPTDLQGESLLLVDPLTLPDHDAAVGIIRAAPAVQFLIQRLADRAVPVAADAESAHLLASIAGRVDGLPLALELAAGQARGRSLVELAELVEAPLDVPAAQHTRNSRHRSLRDTLEWSMTRLEPAGRQVLRRLAVFVGRFDLSAAIAIAGPADPDVGAVVRSLARDALIHVDRTSSSQLNFRLLRTVRDLALEGIEPDELVATQALHRRWHADLWRSTTGDLIPHVRTHLDDYLEALRSSLTSKDAGSLANLVVTLTEFWRFTGGQATGLRWIGIVLDSGILSAGDRARVLAQRAALALHHDPILVLADTAAAIPLLESAGHTADAVTAVSVRALELLAQDRLPEARAHADRAVAVARGRTAEQLANALGTQAVIYAVTESPVRAAAAIDEALVCLRSGITSLEGVDAAGAIALAMVNLERFRDAVDLLDRIEIPPAASPPPARFRLTLGWACIGSHDHSRALACFINSIPTTDTGQPDQRVADRHAAETVLGAACALAGLGDADAVALLAGALELLLRVQYRSPPALGRAITRARAQLDGQPWPDVNKEPTTALLVRLERQLLRGTWRGTVDRQG